MIAPVDTLRPLPASSKYLGVLGVAFFALVFAAGAFDLFDYDLGLSRVTGRWIVEHRAVPTTNVFSDVNATHPFVDDKWLFHVFSYLVVDGMGATAGVFVRIALLAITFALLLPRRSSSTLAHAFGYALAALAVLVAHERFSFRPELFTFLFTALFARRLVYCREPLSKRTFALLVVAQWFWTSLHGYFVLGPILAAASLVGLFLDARLRREPRTDWRRRIALPFALVAVGVVNPYGLDLLLSPLHILRDLEGYEETFKQTIVEFVPPFSYFSVLPYDIGAYRALLGLTALGLVLRNRSLRFVQFLPVLAFFLMSLELRRNMAPFALVSAPFVARALTSAFEDTRVGALLVRAFAVFIPVSCGIVGWKFATDRINLHDRLDRTAGFSMSTIAHPDLEIAFVLENLKDTKLFNSFQFGSYFVGVAYPTMKPFLDGNTAGYPPSFLAEYVSIVTAKTPPKDVVAKWGFTSFLVKPGHPLTRALLADERYVPVCLGRQAVVIVDRQAVPADLLSRFDLRSQLRAGTYRSSLAATESTNARRAFPLLEMNRGRLELALGLSDRAAVSFESATRIEPSVFEPWHALGVARMMLRDERQARAAFERALELAPNAAEVYADRALLNLAVRRTAEARSDIERAIELRGADEDLESRLAAILRASGR